MVLKSLIIKLEKEKALFLGILHLVQLRMEMVIC